MVETFGGAWKTALVEGEILGKGGLRKVRVQWNSFSTPHIQEYGYQHSIFKSSSENHEFCTKKFVLHRKIFVLIQAFTSPLKDFVFGLPHKSTFFVW